MLASAEFSRELTSAVMWLNERGLDVRCVRLRPYADGNRILLDVQQVIPLPEAEDYQVRVREKSRKERAARQSSRDYTKYDVALDGQMLGGLSKREAVFRIIKHLCERGVTPEQICQRVSFRKANAFRSIAGAAAGEDDFLKRVASEEAAQGRKFDPRRWCTADDERIVADGRTYVLTNQWGGRAAEWVEQVLEAFPGHGVELRRAEE